MRRVTGIVQSAAARCGLFASLAAAGGLAACGPAAEPPAPGTPRLVVLISVDQMRFDYLERTGPLLRGGLRRMLDTGVSFTEVHHAHAGTSTAPGHATLASGAHPARHGVISNGWRDPERDVDVYSVWDDEREQESPTHLMVTTLGDWMKARYPEAQVFAMSGKDRAAVLLGGHHADAAFWYDDEDGFESSQYYRGWDDWLDDLDVDEWPRDYLGQLWEPLPLAPEELAAAGVVEPERGELSDSLPRAFGGLTPQPTWSFYHDVEASPFLDDLVARLALEVVERRELGQDEWPDLLAISFSALDIVGHGWGPHSPEALDVVLRLDRTLGELFDEIDRGVGAEHVVVALSADHGVMPLPELGEELGFDGYRAGRDDVLCFQRTNLALAQRFGDGVDWLDHDLYVSRAGLAEYGLDLSEVAAEAARRLEECPIVERAWMHAELAEARGARADAYRNSLYPGRSPDLLIEVPHFALPSTGHRTTHGSPHPYDTHVPLLLMIPPTPGVTAAVGEVSGPVRTVDVAPTLAELVGVAPDRAIDGISLLPRLAEARPAVDAGEENLVPAAP